MDHVIPSARVPHHSLANLVPTDRSCNDNKRDHLPAIVHLQRLRERNGQQADALARAAMGHPEGFAPEATWKTVIAIYGRLSDGLDLWVGCERLEPFHQARWLRVLAA